MPLGEKDSFGTKLKKYILGRIFFYRNIMPKESFFFVASDVVPIVYNKSCSPINPCSLMHMKKSVMRLEITEFKNCNKWTPVYKNYWRWKVDVLKKNAPTPIEKESNQDWNTTIHLKNNGPHIKVFLIFWFLIMIFYLWFYHKLWVKWVRIHIGNSSGHIGQTHSQFQKYLRMSDTECNAHQSYILDNLFD